MRRSRAHSWTITPKACSQSRLFLIAGMHKQFPRKQCCKLTAVLRLLYKPKGEMLGSYCTRMFMGVSVILACQFYQNNLCPTEIHMPPLKKGIYGTFMHLFASIWELACKAILWLHLVTDSLKCLIYSGQTHQFSGLLSNHLKLVIFCFVFSVIQLVMFWLNELGNLL